MATVSHPVGAYRHRVGLANPTGFVPDGDGGYTEGFAPLDPPDMDASIEAASTRDLERVTAGTVLATATHLVRMRFHPGVTVQTRITFGDRVFEVQSVTNVDERNIALILICGELVQDGNGANADGGGSQSGRAPKPPSPGSESSWT
jgi:head-tail adaptor